MYFFPDWHWFPLWLSSPCHNDEINLHLHSLKGQCIQTKNALKWSCSRFITSFLRRSPTGSKNDPEVEGKPELNIFSYVLRIVTDLHLGVFCSIHKLFNIPMSYPSSAITLYHPYVRTCHPNHFGSTGKPKLLNLMILPGSAKRTKAFTDIWISSGYNTLLCKAAFIGHLDREATVLSKNAILSEVWQSHSTITTVLP